MTPTRPGRPLPPRRPPAPRSTPQPSQPPSAQLKPKELKPKEPQPTQRSPAPPLATPRHDPAPHSTVTTYAAGRRAIGFPARPAVVSTGSADRFAERLAARRQVLRRKIYLTAAVVVAALVLAWLLLLSPALALDPAQVQVSGAGTVVAVDDVNAVVARVAGIPLPRLDTVALRDRVLDVPGVREAKVIRGWPRALVISLVSREPVAAVPQAPAAAGLAPGQPPGFTLLDTEGYQVGWAAAAPDGLPVVSVPIDGKNERILAAVLTVLQALPESLRAEVATVAATSQDTVEMGLRDGATVSWGSAGDAALKVAVLQALRAAPATAAARAFDVSAPTLPITR